VRRCDACEEGRARAATGPKRPAAGADSAPLGIRLPWHHGNDPSASTSPLAPNTPPLDIGSKSLGYEWSARVAARRGFLTDQHGGTYISFLTEDEGPERLEAALGKGLQRLAEVKANWDPQNVFRTNRNIRPA